MKLRDRIFSTLLIFLTISAIVSSFFSLNVSIYLFILLVIVFGIQLVVIVWDYLKQCSI